jgi:hypothetical protein
MRALFWDREGNPIDDVIEWAKKFEDAEYRIVAVDQDAEGAPMVSTIWQGMDMARNFRDDITPMIFETVLLEADEDNPGEGKIIRSDMSATEEQARFTHNRYCEDHLNREAAPDNGLKHIIVERDK